MNNVCLVGRAGGDPEMKYFDSGSVVTNINMAINRPTKDKQTDWFTIKFWGKTAETAGAYVKKGHQFGVIGELQEEKWEKDGEKRSKIVIVARQLNLMQPKSDGDTAAILGSTEEIPF